VAAAVALGGPAPHPSVAAWMVLAWALGCAEVVADLAGPAYPNEYLYLDLGDGSFEEIYGPEGYQAEATFGRVSCDRVDEAIPNSNARYVTCWYSDSAGWYIEGQEPAPNGDMSHTAALLDAAIRGGAGPV
jgi:hypothetical protein